MRKVVVLGVVTVLFGLTAALWGPVVVPRLVLLPTDFSTEIDTEGTFEVFVAPGSLARLPESTSLPLAVSVDVTASDGGDGLLLVDMAQKQKVGPAGGPTQDLDLAGRFVVDRRTARNVDDPRAWAYTEDNKVNRDGTYSFSLGFDFNAGGTYPFWDDTIGDSYDLHQGGDAAKSDTQGLASTSMTGTAHHAADSAFIAALKPLALPESLTVEQWKDAGFDVSGEGDVTVDYLVDIQTDIAIHDLTGATVNLTELQLTLSYRPDSAATGDSEAELQKVFVSTVNETDASVDKDAALIEDNIGKIELAERWIPLGLAVLALAGAGATALFGWRERRQRADAG
jgi:hypothetical protein